MVYPNWRQAQSQEARASNLSPSPTGAMRDTFKEGFGGISEQFRKIKEAISGFNVGAEYYSATSSEESQDSATTTLPDSL